MNSINTVNGVLVAAQSDFAGHAEDKTIHLAEEDRPLGMNLLLFRRPPILSPVTIYLPGLKRSIVSLTLIMI